MVKRPTRQTDGGEKYRSHPLPRDRRPADFSQSRPQQTDRRCTRVDFSLLTLHRGYRLHKEVIEVVLAAPPDRSKPYAFHVKPRVGLPGISTRRSRRHRRTAALHFLRTGLLPRFQNTRTPPQSAPWSQEYEMNADLIPGMGRFGQQRTRCFRDERLLARR
jgi:hypothetical protein